MAKPKIAFLIPSYGSIGLRAWSSHIGLLVNAEKFCEPTVLFHTSCYVHKSRNNLVKTFLEADRQIKFDYAFWLDSDIVFSYEQCKKMVEVLSANPNSIISGVYFTQAGESKVPIASKYDSKSDSYKYIEASQLKGEKIEVDSCGLGFTLQTAQSLRDLAQEHKKLFDYRESKTGEMIGEDNYFFELAKKSGYKILLIPSIKVGHEKSVVL